MKMAQVAAQLYTLSGFTKTETEIADALRRVKAMGYDAVQVSGLGPVGDADLARMLDGEGLVCCATHEPAEKILAEPQACVERLHRLSCRYTAYPYPAGIDFSDTEALPRLARALDRAGRVFCDAGAVLCYHNHHMEFRKAPTGETFLDYVFAHTDARYLQGEIDTYWVQYGGGDPVAWCKKLAGRLPLLHLKDYAVDAQNQVRFTDVGGGNLDFPAIIAAAQESGCEWFIVERDPSPGDPFDSLKASYDYLEHTIAEGD